MTIQQTLTHTKTQINRIKITHLDHHVHISNEQRPWAHQAHAYTSNLVRSTEIGQEWKESTLHPHYITHIHWDHKPYQTQIVRHQPISVRASNHHNTVTNIDVSHPKNTPAQHSTIIRSLRTALRGIISNVSPNISITSNTRPHTNRFNGRPDIQYHYRIALKQILLPSYSTAPLHSTGHSRSILQNNSSSFHNSPLPTIQSREAKETR